MSLKDRLNSFGSNPAAQAALILLSVPLAISTILHKLRVLEYSRQWVLVDVLAITFIVLWLIVRPPRRVRGLMERNYRMFAAVGVSLVIAYGLLRVLWRVLSSAS